MPSPILPNATVPVVDKAGAATRSWRDLFAFLASFVQGNPLGRRIIYCAGTPNGQITGSIGDVAIRTDGGASTTWYVKESGTNTDTGWVGK